MRTKEGWTWLFNSPKWHYFKDGRSLCGRFSLLRMDDLETGDTASQDNCKTCYKKRMEIVNSITQKP